MGNRSLHKLGRTQGRDNQVSAVCRIKRNAAECKLCGEVIESKHRHDFRTCKCGNISVDGGQDYIRRLWIKDDSLIDRSEYFQQEQQQNARPITK